ncbi:MAG: 4-(cytidine 5'-diphospho)-2-C-methyl-D-erythritol kinase [Bryobacteraceae bacterium]|nr:4-(cytidine 5'-diphospho)-2-C-methyl-D-erythritol kinase [Bryobacterales bacterium]MEB2361580.1 4-(cytidine 5'-diphospho)-2-C-methyl-D-erythritol kinase [Bryobacterales bacterium]NUN00491.1 4-(cytidine 5'-diphospho)-2-C-methyl-D-erythritol kinase [Bryobacteraceae bacterium]
MFSRSSATDPGFRSARVKALAKINLALKVLNKRPDGFHDLRTIFQTVSLSDAIDIGFQPGGPTAIEVESSIDIADNLVFRAAQAVMRLPGTGGGVRIHLQKNVPMGSGLGGGSSDAAAVLLALPVLTGRRIGLETLLCLGADLGSDVPFFLLGGAAVGLGRGTELYPLPEMPRANLVLVAPGIHVSTPEAYALLSRELTTDSVSHTINIFQSVVWTMADSRSFENDFEAVVFRRHPQLQLIKQKLLLAGAVCAMLSGSGSAVIGVFEDAETARRVAESFDGYGFPARIVTRAHYRAMWWRQLAAHIDGKVWPPKSRYAE